MFLLLCKTSPVSYKTDHVPISQSNLTKAVRDSSHVLCDYLHQRTQPLHVVHIQRDQETCAENDAIVAMTTKC